MPNADIKYWYLHDHKLFRNLSFSEIDSLCILKRFKKSKRDEIVELPFSEKDRIYFLKQGSLKLIRIDEEGEEVLVDVLQKGDLFGELSLNEDKDAAEFMRVVSSEAVICTFFRDKLEEVMLKKPDFALNYIKFIGFNYQKIQNSYRNILFRDAKTRLLLLLDSFIDKAESDSNEFQLPAFLTQKDMAQLICTTRQTIITLLKELETEGLIQHKDRQLILPDIKKIKNLTQRVK